MQISSNVLFFNKTERAASLNVKKNPIKVVNLWPSWVSLIFLFFCFYVGFKVLNCPPTQVPPPHVFFTVSIERKQLLVAFTLSVIITTICQLKAEF